MLKVSKTRVVNEETGEIIEEKVITQDISIESEPAYIKTYISDIMRIQGLTGYTNKVMAEIIKMMGYNNIFMAYAPVKRLMCANLNLGMDSINKAIDNLVKVGILIRTERGVYLVDPNLFAKGKWADIKKLRLTIEYDKETGKKTLRSNINTKGLI